ncbi:DMT family transporter [Sediminibacterium soli]|uniref:DMT family transporter n=1 Tax=Sediminibacterium soli TaxID=2698829 RepID=UPI0013796C32|nr:DMT family transporter [Sediminibacterium soli]NCI47318.1 DMT family transporter [Sediminibacterium soli]
MKGRLFNWLIFVILSIVWGSSFVLMKEGMVRLSPYQVASLRILSAGAVLVPFAWKAIKAIPKNKVVLVLLSGLLGNFFPAYLFCIAETKLDSALAGILNALTPFFVILIGMGFFQLKAGAIKILGVIIGFIGLCLLMLASGNLSFQNASYSLYILLATAFYGLNVNMVGRHLQGIGSLHIASLAFVFLVIPCIVILSFTGYFSLPFTERAVLLSTLASCVLGVMGTAIASILFYMLIKRAGNLFASMVTYGIPFIAVMWGVWYGEHISLLQVGCLGIILIGVYLVNRK